MTTNVSYIFCSSYAPCQGGVGRNERTSNLQPNGQGSLTRDQCHMRPGFGTNTTCLHRELVNGKVSQKLKSSQHQMCATILARPTDQVIQNSWISRDVVQTIVAKPVPCATRSMANGLRRVKLRLQMHTCFFAPEDFAPMCEGQNYLNPKE